MTGMLASVSNLNEALQVLPFDADIIDLKQPSRGALGALDPEEVSSIVTAIDGQCMISATIGDLPMRPEVVTQAVQGMGKTGVDYIKVGVFPGDDWAGTLTALGDLAVNGLSLIAVLFADTQPDFKILPSLKSAGFKGVMIDTMDKQKGSLTQIMASSDIKAFVDSAARHKLICGLAGSLRREDIPHLITYQPDYLGFRGALCQHHNRTARLDDQAIKTIKTCMLNACR
ncbi:MAG: (5-formylfuran-3-yl)methyl phosphate synthase [Gammaproteobacteria bacterium]